VDDNLIHNDGISDSANEADQQTLSKYGRRALMLGAAAGVGAAASLAAKPEIASAQDTDFLLGEGNTATATTSLEAKLDNSSDSSEPTLLITNLGTGPAIYGTNFTSFSAGTGPGVVGLVVGGPDASPGVWGQNGSTGPGVLGDDLEIGTGPGVFGQVQNTSNTSPAVQGESAGSGPGVYGESIGPSGLSGTAGTAGVVGDSNTNPGVVGLSSVANGVKGITTATDYGGVIGFDQSSGGGFGVQGYTESATGVGISAVAVESTATALQVEGVATFSRSGLVSIAAGKTTATITGVVLSASSLVLANLQNSLSGVYVVAVVTDVSGSKFEIYLSKAVPSGKTAHVGGLVVN
jgi:hypothetical protein